MKTINVKIWNGTQKAYADETSIVWVWDPVAGHYTSCHSLTKNQQNRVRRLTMA